MFIGCNPSHSARSKVEPDYFALDNFKSIPPAERKQKLDPMQYRVTQEAATEPAFANAYWDNHQPGIPGVIKTTVGYTGGTVTNPTYEMVCSHTTGHAEAVQVVFDPAKLSYEHLLDVFFRSHDPTTRDEQKDYTVAQYRSAIFYTSEEQKQTAKRIKTQVDKSGNWKLPVATQISKASTFYPAEDYHQDYYQKNPGGYSCRLRN